MTLRVRTRIPLRRERIGIDSADRADRAHATPARHFLPVAVLS